MLADRHVGPIGYGTRQLVTCERDRAVEVVRRAVALGVKHIDTADYFGPGAANDVVRAALFPYADDIAIATKVGVNHDPDKTFVPAQRPEQLRASVEANLRRLGLDQLTMVYLRRVDTGPRLMATGDQKVDLESQLAVLAAMRDEGKIRSIGLSNVNLAQLLSALPVGIACVQNVYNVCERDAEPILDACRRHDIAWVPFFPLGSPTLAAPVREHPAVIAIARTVGATPSQVGLAWLLAHNRSTLLIPSTCDLRHLEQNVAAEGVSLSSADLAVLDALARGPSE